MLMFAATALAQQQQIQQITPEAGRIDRNGAQRNRGAGPGYRSVDAYGYVPVPLDRIIKRSLTLDVALRAENLLGARNFTTLNGVLGSPLFGQPLGALPGRSVRVSISVRR